MEREFFLIGNSKLFLLINEYFYKSVSSNHIVLYLSIDQELNRIRCVV